jgi:competence protein ComEA
MNSRERTVLIFLIVVLLAGVGINLVKRARQQTNLKQITIAIHPATDSSLPTPHSTPDSSSLAASSLAASSLLINLNTASAAELDLLPGIGPALSQRIIDYRKSHEAFRSKEELMKVSGIGPKKYAAVKDKVTVKP